jgi:translocation and assembly module TamB
MALQAEATGDVQVPNPLDKSADALSTIAVQAKVMVEGTLATDAARLAIKANASAEASAPDPGAQDPQATKPKQDRSGGAPEAATAAASPMQADVEASIMPWRSQPLLAAKVRLQNLDVSAFWPQGPRTLLTGQLQAGPDETVPTAANLEAQPWLLNTRFSNALPGPWDRQRLPVTELTARIDFDGQQWQVGDSRIQIGKGHIALGGQFTPSTRLFEGLATVEQLNPADLYSTLEASPLQGRISARAVQADVDSSDPAASKIVFDANLQAAGSKRDSRALRIQTLAASGQWQVPQLQLEKLQLQALQASVDARSVEFNTETQQAKARLKATAPGAQLNFDGQMSPASGAVQSQLQLSSMSTLTQWLRKLPGVKDPLGGAQLDGSADLQLALKGGWENLLKRLSAPHGAAIPASGLQIQAKLRAEKIRYLPAGTAVDQGAVLPALALNIDGSPENARIGLTAQAQQAALHPPRAIRGPHRHGVRSLFADGQLRRAAELCRADDLHGRRHDRRTHAGPQGLAGGDE